MKKLILQPENPKKKDPWEKAGVVAQFLSGVVIAAVGAYFTASNNKAQLSASASNATAQMKISDRQQASSYLNQVIGQKDVGARADLVGALDLALRPEDAIPIALRYAHPDQDRLVVGQALGVLRRLAKEGESTLDDQVREGLMPNAAIAEAILGRRIRIRTRISQIDDFGRLALSVSGHKGATWISPTFRYGQDSGWIDITDKLKSGVANMLMFDVSNDEFGGTSGRLEISAGTQQYDSGLVTRKSSLSYAPSFYIMSHLSVYEGAGMDGSVILTVEKDADYHRGFVLPLR